MDCPEGAKLIPLTQGQFTIVDDKVFNLVNKYKWHAALCFGRYYARRSIPNKGKQQIIYMHREISKANDDQECHHVNKQSLDNRCQNLLLCTPIEHVRITRPGRTRHGRELLRAVLNIT